LIYGQIKPLWQVDSSDQLKLMSPRLSLQQNLFVSIGGLSNRGRYLSPYVFSTCNSEKAPSQMNGQF